MKYKNVLFTFLMIAGILLLASLASAEDDLRSTPPNSSSAGALEERSETIVNRINEIKNKIEAKKTEVQQLRTDLKADKAIHGRIVNGVVAAVNGTTFTVKSETKDFTVTTDANTKCVRHYYGKCSLSEIVVNDKVSVWGNFTDTTQTTILAKLIRDNSIMKKHGVFLGNITSISDSSFVIQSKERGSQTVNVTVNTKYIQRNEQPSSFADLKVGQRVRVRGIWDKVNNTVSEVTEVKNYSLPVRPSETPEETPGKMPPANTSPTLVPSTTTVTTTPTNQ